MQSTVLQSAIKVDDQQPSFEIDDEKPYQTPELNGPPEVESSRLSKEKTSEEVGKKEEKVDVPANDTSNA